MIELGAATSVSTNFNECSMKRWPANSELEKDIAFFGKRRQKYLRRMGRQRTKPER